MKQGFGIASIGVLGLLSSGCFQIKNTDGLKLAYEDVDRASSKGVELHSLTEITEQQRNEAADLYREAKAVVNSYLQGAITEAADYTVDNPAEAYIKSGASKKVKAFEARVNMLRGTERTLAVWAPIAAAAITEIVKLHNEWQKAAYDRFVNTVRQYMMKNYEELPSGGTDG